MELKTVHFERSVALAVIGVVLLTGQLRLRGGIPSFAVYAALAAVGITAALGENTAWGWNKFYLYFTVVVFFVVLISTIRSPYQLMFIIASYVVVMSVYLAKAQWEYFLHGAGASQQGYLRLQGIERSFGNPNSLGPGIVFSLPFLVLLFSTRDIFTETWPAFWRRWFVRGLVVYAALAVTSVFLTRSRSAAACLVVFLLLQGTRSAGLGRKLRGLSLVAILCFATFLVLPADMQRRMRTMWNPDAGTEIERESALGRWEGFLAGVAIFREQPITGIGPGSFRYYRYWNVDETWSDSHNMVGQVLAETGLVGTSAFSFLFIVIYLTCRRLRFLTADSDDPLAVVFNQLAWACRDVLILLLFGGLFQHNLYRFNWLWIAAFSMLATRFFRLHLLQKAERQEAQISISPSTPRGQFRGGLLAN